MPETGLFVAKVEVLDVLVLLATPEIIPRKVISIGKTKIQTAFISELVLLTNLCLDAG